LATLFWLLSTPFDDIRCFAWEEGDLWVVAVYFGEDMLQMEVVADRASVAPCADALRQGLLDAGMGEAEAELANAS
jgi:hypothetical protein